VQKALLDTQSKIKIERAREGLKKWFITRLENHEYKANALTIANFLIAAKIESNIAISYSHAVSRDLSCRPHELLKLRIKDVVFKMAGDRQYAEILVSGKTGQRHIPLINSIPYLKD
jgi:integrase/recombinase XerD